MSAQVALKAHLNALLDNAAKDRAEEAPEAWASLEKIVRSTFTSEDDKGLACQILFAHEDALPTFVADTVKYKEQGTGRTGHAKTREAIYKWMEVFLRSMSPQKAPAAAAGAVEAIALYGFRREADNYARAASLLPIQAGLEMKLPPWTTDRDAAQQLAEQLQGVYLLDKKASETVRAGVLEALGLLVEVAPQDSFTGRFTRKWLLDECSMALDRVARSGKPQALMAAGALAGLSGAFSASEEEETRQVVDAAWSFFARTIRSLDSLKRYQGLKAALRMVTNQTARFRRQLVAGWLTTLTALTNLSVHSNRDVRTAAGDALSACLREVGRAMCAPDADAKVQAQILGHFTQQLVKPALSQRETAVAVEAVGALAASTTRNFGEPGVRKLLEYLTPLGQRRDVSESDEQGGEASASEVALLKALALVASELPSVPAAALQQCMSIAERLASAYPRLWPKQRATVDDAFIGMLQALSAKQGVLATLLPRLVASILAHTLRPAGDTQRPGNEPPRSDAEQSWQLYLPLWSTLISGKGHPDGVRADLSAWAQPTYDGLMSAVLDALRNLDLDYQQDQRVNAAGQAGRIADITEDGDAAADGEVLVGLRPHSVADMRAFLNLSAFLTELLPLLGPQLFSRWGENLVTELMAGSKKRPLLSGYYRLMEMALQLSVQSCLLTAEGSFGQIVRAWLLEVSVLVRRYKDELLSAVLDLLLSAPSTIFPPQELFRPLKLALQLGLQQPPLAARTLKALERLEMQSPAALQALVHDLMPLLEPYLAPVRDINAAALPPSAENGDAAGSAQGREDGEEEAAGDAARRVRDEAEAALRRRQQACMEGLAALQPKMQAWLGRLGSWADTLALGPVAPELQGHAISKRWDAKDMIGLKVSFPGMERADPVLWLDNLLPLAADLAERSTERAVRVASCEFLHASILWMIGTNARRPLSRDEQDFAAQTTQFHGILKRILPVALRLASGPEPVARQLFEPLVTSLVHWFTRAARREAAETMALLEAIMEGLTDSQNGALRDLCAAATREFLVWSAKHIPASKDPTKGSSAENMNAGSLLRRLFERMAHPEPYQRLGACLAMKHCAEALAKEPDLADTYLLYSLQQVMLALRAAESDPAGTGTRQLAAEAMQELVRQLYRRPKITLALLEPQASRTGPASLQEVMDWLWPLTAAPQRAFRANAMWLHKQLAALLQSGSGAGDKNSNETPTAQWFKARLNASEKMAGHEAEHCMRMSAPECVGSSAKSYVQELEGKLHWAIWAVDLGMASPSDISVRGSKGARAVHAAAALPQQYAMLHEQSAGRSSAFMGKLAGCERDIQRLSSVALTYLTRVVAEPGMEDMLKATGVHHLVLGALLDPQALGIPYLEDQSCRSIALLAKGLLEAAAKDNSAALYSFKAALAQRLQQLPLLTAHNQGDGLAASLLSGAEGTSVAAVRGLTVLADAALPASLSLLPAKLRASLPDRLLRSAADMSGKLSPRQQAVMEGALNLALRLGLPAEKLLEQLLHDEGGAELYQAYHRAVTSWVLWNANAVCKQLCQALGSPAQQAADVAQHVLAGTLEALQRGGIAGHLDPRARSFLGALLPHWHLTQPLTDGAASMEKSLVWLRLLRQLLALDAAAVLRPAQQSSAFILKSYLSVLNSRNAVPEQRAQAAQVRNEALQLLGPFLALPADIAQRVHSAVEAIVSDVFPVFSQDLQRASTQATEYAMQLLAMMDAAVQAASSGTHVEAILEALLPVIREMGTPRGHARQSSLETRLALIAAAPWKGAPGKNNEDLNMAAEGQALSLLSFAWGYVFEAPTGTLHFMDIRRAMLHHVLMPVLRFAPLAFQVSALQERAPRLRDILGRGAASAPSLMGNEEAGLFAREAAYTILQHMYGAVPPATIRDRVLASIGGNKEVTIWAMKDVRELSASEEALEAAARSARCAAFATAAACIAATQDKEGLFANPLKMPGKSADPSGPWERLLDVSKALELPVVLDSSSQARRVAGGIRAAAQRIRAERAGSTQNTLGSLSSLSATASLTDKLTSSQYALDDSEAGTPSDGNRTGVTTNQQDNQEEMDAEESLSTEDDTLLYEDDALDRNACMLPLVRFIEKASSLYNQGTETMPAWMSLLLGSVASPATPQCARLFLVKAVLHVEARYTARMAAAAEQEQCAPSATEPSLFGRFAAQWFPAMVSALIGHIQAPSEAGVHYLLLEACVTFLSWDSLFPVPPRGDEASQLMNYLVSAAYSEDHSVQRNNFSLIKAFASKWPTLPPPPDALLPHITAGGPQAVSGAKGRLSRQFADRRLFGLRLASAGLLYSQAKALLALPRAHVLVQRVIGALAINGGQRFAAQAGETAGLLLKQLHRLTEETQNALGHSPQDVDKDMRQSLVTIFNSRPDMALCSLERLSAYYSLAVDSLQSHVIAALPSAAGLFKSMALRALARRAEHLPGLLSELRPHLKRLLIGQSDTLQAATLALLEALLPREPDVEAGWVLSIVLEASDFTRHPSKTVRLHLFAIQRDAWQLRPSLQVKLRPPLLAMLGDADPEVQGQALAFWHSALPRTLSARLASVLSDTLEDASAWKERLEELWPRAASSLLLRLSADEPAYDSPIFDTELADCKFSEYPIDTWSKATLAVAPLFSATWEAAASQSASQDAFGGGYRAGSQMTQAREGLVRATQAGTASLSLNLTLPNDAGTQQLVPAGSPARPGLSSTVAAGSSLTPQTRIYRRLNRFRGSNTGLLALARRREELRHSQVAARENRVTLFRKYRTGELPDIQRVTVAAFLGPLDIIAASSSAAQLLITAMFKVVKTAQPSALPPVRAALALCFERQPRSAAYVGALQRLAIEDRGGAVDAAEVASAAVQSGSLQSGALQLEEAMLFGKQPRKAEAEPAAKRKRSAASVSGEPEVATDEANWAALAEVYMRLGESHLAHVACSNHLARCPGTRQAMSAAAERRPLTAYALYEGLMRAVSAEDPAEAMDIEGSEALTPQLLLGGQEPTKQEEDLWFQERSRCMEEMGDWGKVLEVISSENAETAAEDEAAGTADPSDERLFLKEEGWDGPKYLRSFVRACLFQPGEHQRLDSLVGSAAGDAGRTSALERAAPVELAVHAASSGSWDRCQAAVEAAWQRFRDGWADLHPLSTARRVEALAQLQPLAELQESLDFVRKVSDPASAASWQAVADLAGRWSSRWPSMQQGSSAAALTVIYSRDIALQSVAAELAKTAQVPHKDVMELRARMAVSGAAALQRQGFLDAAQEILQQYRGSAGSEAAAATAEAELHIALAQAEYSQSHLSRQQLEQCLDGFQLKLSGKARAADAQRRNILLAKAIHFLQPQDVQATTKVMKMYQEASEMHDATASAEEAGKAAMQLARLCDELLKDEEMHTQGDLKGSPVSAQLDTDVSSTLVRSMFQGLALGGSSGVEAQLMVPRALTVLEGREAAQQAWSTAWHSAPLHLLLPWAAQMLSLLGSAEGAALLPALKALSEGYKQRLYFPFSLSKQHYSRECHARAAELAPLLQSPVLDMWAAALNDTTYPAQRWQAWVSQLDRLLSNGHKAEATKLYAAEVYPDIVSRHRARSERGRSGVATYSSQAAGKLDKLLQDAYGSNGSKLAKMDPRTFKIKAMEVSGAAQKLTEGLSGKWDLAKLSPWLAEYSAASGAVLGEPLLMPWMPSMGGLSGSLPPDVHIVGFGKTASVFSSKQKPKELTIYGSDFRSYKWIVKGGEDVRTDERMEMILDVCNGLLARHPGAASHRLKVRTYDVVPVSSSLGLVEFVPGTQPLKNAIMAFIEPEVDAKAMVQYSNNIADLAKGTPGGKQGSRGYPYLGSFHAAAEAAASKLQAVEGGFRWDALRDALLRQAGGPEEFLAMRANYAASLAAVSVTGYITGAGDRHLENFLMHTASGTLIPIDFGYSFGTGAQVLPIPELTPFRLTRQMRGALQPHDACAVLRTPCALGMAALRAGAGGLEGILGVYMREPLLDWQKEGRLLKDARTDSTQAADTAEDMHIAAKVQTARDKLHGRHPSDILLAELAPKYSSTAHWTALQLMVRGQSKVSKRAQIAAAQKPKTALTPEEQVDCLLDQATDASILGRTWAGWRPFV